MVTGGGGGIGTEAALELARCGVAVVAMDPGVGVQGEPLGERSAAATADRIMAAGGTAIASTASVTDRAEVRALFRDVVDRFGGLDIVVNTAGILRFGTYLEESDDDWGAVLDVHFTGYLNVLAEALPLMVAAGYGRIVGFTSGVGLARTNPGGPSYSAAKRAVAALSWQLGLLLPDGVSVSVLSPIAATRMVRGGLVAAGASPRGLDLSAMPQPEHMAPAAAYLASEAAGWLSGSVVFSAGPELSIIAPPRLVEIVRTNATPDVARALGTVVPVVLNPAEAQQRTTGGSNPRLGNVFDQAADPVAAAAGLGRTVIVTDDVELAAAVGNALGPWGHSTARLAPTRPGLDTDEPVDAVVVALGPPPGSGEPGSWAELVESHTGVAGHVVAHARWLRAAGELAMRTSRPLRVVLVADAATPAGRTTAQAVSQVARCVNETPGEVPVDVFAVSVEPSGARDTSALAALIARLAVAEDTRELRGAELVAGSAWIGLRSHPGPAGTVTFGGIAIPDWVDGALHTLAAQ